MLAWRRHCHGTCSTSSPQRVQHVDWHVQLQMDGRDCRARSADHAWPGTIVIDHNGKFLEPVDIDTGVPLPAAPARHGRVWVKLSAPYETSRAGPRATRMSARSPRHWSQPRPSARSGRATGRTPAFASNHRTKPRCSTCCWNGRRTRARADASCVDPIPPSSTDSASATRPRTRATARHAAARGPLDERRRPLCRLHRVHVEQPACRGQRELGHRLAHGDLVDRLEQDEVVGLVDRALLPLHPQARPAS